jgi:Zn-dependent M16 (insulinase) family peptidase
MSYVSRASYYQDATGGIACFRVIEDYEMHFEEKKGQLIRKLQTLIRRIFTVDRMMVSITCEEKDLDAVKKALLALKSGFYEEKAAKTGRILTPWKPEKRNEGFMDASQVQYVARAGNFIDHGFKYDGALRILKVIMGYDYLWNNIRVKGGAYGCMNGYMTNGDAYFVSYRDPNLSATNDVYDGIPEYLEHFTADEREMTKYIIGTISDMDAPLNPSAKGARSMAAYLQKITSQDIQSERNQVIEATEKDIRNLKGMIEAVLSDGAFCAIGNEEKINSEKYLFHNLEYLCS